MIDNYIMKIAVMAAGGIGGYYGGLLAQAGHQVTFVARGMHLAAIREHGLSVKSIDDEFCIKLAQVVDDPSTIGIVDMVLFSVKTYDTDSAAHAVKPCVGSETIVVTFQNGVESADRIKKLVGNGHIVPAPTQIETFIAAPGRIEQKSNFRVVVFSEEAIQSYPPLNALAEIFRRAKFQVNVVPDARKAVWLKFLRLAPVAGLATLAREDPYFLFQREEAREALLSAMREIVDVARAEGIMLDEQDLGAANEWALGIRQGIKPSMQKDIERGNRLEIDALSGAAVRLGRKHGIGTPVNLAIFVGLKPEDDRNRQAREGSKSSRPDAAAFGQS